MGSGAVGSGGSGGGSSGGSGDAAASNVQERDAKCPTLVKSGGADLSDIETGSGDAGNVAGRGTGSSAGSGAGCSAGSGAGSGAGGGAGSGAGGGAGSGADSPDSSVSSKVQESDAKRQLPYGGWGDMTKGQRQNFKRRHWG